MKKIITIILLASVFRASAQLPVTDVVHAGISTSGWIQSMADAIVSTTELLNIFGQARETVSNLDDIIEQVEKINELLRNAEMAQYAALDLVAMADMLTQFSRQLAHSYTNFSIDEKREVLDAYSSILRRATYNLSVLKDYTVGGRWRMTDKERMDAMQREADKIAAEREQMERLSKMVQDEISKRAQRDLITQKATRGEIEGVNAADLYYMWVSDNVPIGAEVALELSEELKGMREEQETSAATKEISGIWSIFFKIYYVICALIGLIGGYKVYAKVQMGEDLTKSVWIWGGSALTLFFAGLLVQYFFF